MKRGLILLIGAAVLISALAVRSNIRTAAAKRKREIGYAVALKTYSEALHPGMTRRDVEAYLRSRNTQFSWVYTAYGGRRESQYADTVKIGEEASPWYCSEAYVYIAFEFTPAGDVHSQSDSDALQRIEFFRPYTGCL
jgi:hypothetical protein